MEASLYHLILSGMLGVYSCCQHLLQPTPDPSPSTVHSCRRWNNDPENGNNINYDSYTYYGGTSTVLCPCFGGSFAKMEVHKPPGIGNILLQ